MAANIPKPVMTAIGLMSGTSLDGIDVARIRTDGVDFVEKGEGATYPYPDEIRNELIALLGKPEQVLSSPLDELEKAVTDAQIQAIRFFLSDFQIAPQQIDIIGFHGQTVLHRPEQKFTRQLGLGQHMASRTGIPVVSQFRLADVAAGGEGAPLAPIYHKALASRFSDPLVILNLGGVANITYIDQTHMLAFDTGPASALIDDYMRNYFNRPFDEDGQIASSGKADTASVQEFLNDPYFSRKPPKSLDRNAFHRWNRLIQHLPSEDAIATLTAYTVESIAISCNYMPYQAKFWFVGGGGRKNRFMLKKLESRLQVPVQPVEEMGWDGDFLEAQAFAYLAVRHIGGLPLTFPQTTGIAAPLCGGIFSNP